MSVSTVKYCKSTTKTYIITPTYTFGFIFECSIYIVDYIICLPTFMKHLPINKITKNT